MRVLHVSQPHDAGVPAVVLALVADQARRGHDLHVACPSASVLTARVPAHGGRVHTWEATRDPGPGTVQEVWVLGRTIADVDPDVVVLHSAKAGFAGRLAVRGRRPTVLVPHAWSFLASDGLVGVAATWWERWASRWTDLLVCVGTAELERGRAAGVRGASVVIDNGTDLAAADRRTPEHARAELGLVAAPTVVCVGRLTRQKGQDLLLEAWPEVARRAPGAQLVLVGDGPDGRALRELARPGVTFVGARDDVPALLAAADVVAVPSRWEGAALVTLEAMAAGRPVVGFDVDGMAHAVARTGVVVPREDVPALASALVGLLTDPAAARAAGAAARARVEEHFDLVTTLEQWDRELARVVAARGGGRGRAGREPLD